MRVIVIIFLLCYIVKVGNDYKKLENELEFFKVSINNCERKLNAKQEPTQKRPY
jgi:topoisomerase IA-like protein